MSITEDLATILSARYGKDVRQSIHDSIYEINEVAKKAEYDASTAPESAKAYAQAALASEQAAEDYKTAAEQAAEQAMSGTPEGYADLVAKVNSIYRQTATSFNVVGTSEGSALARTIYGMSVQDGTPTPDSPVEIQSAKADFKCVGKNLINPTLGELTLNGVICKQKGDGTYVLNGTHTSSLSQFYLQQNLKVKKGQYRYVGTKGGSDSTWKSGIYIDPNRYYDDFGNGVNINFTEDTTVIIRIVIYGATVFNDVTFKPMLTLDLSATYDDYEPYKETKVTTDLTLRAIEVASTDDYNLARDGKYYIADTLDWSEDSGYVLTRRINEVDLGDYSYAYFSENAIFQTTMSGILNTDYLQKVAISSGFEHHNGSIASMTHGHWRLNASGENLVDFKYSGTTDASTFKAAVAGIQFIYILATPTTEPITAVQAQALLSLKTYDEATSISATGDIEPSVNLEYSKDRNTALALTGHNLAHKNALKLNDINTALIELGGN